MNIQTGTHNVLRIDAPIMNLKFDEYVAYLMTVSELEFVDEIDCAEDAEGDNRRNSIMFFAMK